jgi:hypothetical protein
MGEEETGAKSRFFLAKKQMSRRKNYTYKAEGRL